VIRPVDGCPAELLHAAGNHVDQDVRVGNELLGFFDVIVTHGGALSSWKGNGYVPQPGVKGIFKDTGMRRLATRNVTQEKLQIGQPGKRDSSRLPLFQTISSNPLFLAWSSYAARGELLGAFCIEPIKAHKCTPMATNSYLRSFVEIRVDSWENLIIAFGCGGTAQSLFISISGLQLKNSVCR